MAIKCIAVFANTVIPAIAPVKRRKYRAIVWSDSGRSSRCRINTKIAPQGKACWKTVYAESNGLLEQAMNELNLSARAHDRILEVSRMMADLESAENISANHLLEAIQYRTLDRNLWG